MNTIAGPKVTVPMAQWGEYKALLAEKMKALGIEESVVYASQVFEAVELVLADRPEWRAQ